MAAIINKLFTSLFCIFTICFYLAPQINVAHARHVDKDFFFKEQVFNASIDKISGMICDYDNYTKYFEHMSKSKVYDNSDINAPKVYFELRVFGRTFWAKVKLTRIANVDGTITINVKTIDTNLKVLYGNWELIPIDEHHTKLIIHGIAKPYMPMPDSFLKNLIKKEVSLAFKKISHFL